MSLEFLDVSFYDNEIRLWLLALLITLAVLIVLRLVRWAFTWRITAGDDETTPKIIREVIEAQEYARFDRAHFFQYGESALNFEVVYFVLSSDYNLYMDTNQAINLGIFRRFSEEGIEFAYPTRTLEIKSPLPAPLGNGSQG